MNGLMVGLDYMHNMFLGYLQYLYASIIVVLIEDLLPGEKLPNLKAVSAWIHSFQKSNHTKYKFRPKLYKLSMVYKKTGYPRLRGRAADIYGLAPAMKSLWETYMLQENRPHRLISLVLKANHELDELLRDFSPTFGYIAIPENKATHVFELGCRMMQICGQLQDFYKSENRKIFNLTSKSHFALHSLQFSKYVHPAVIWCFKGESHIHRQQQVWKSCLKGNRPWDVQVTATFKERYLMYLRNKIG